MADRLVLNPASGAAVASAFARPLSLPATGLEVAQFVALRAAACVGAEYSNLAVLDAFLGAGSANKWPIALY